MNYIFIFSFDISYGIEECYLHAIPGYNLTVAWEQVKKIDPDISFESLDMINITPLCEGGETVQATRFYCQGSKQNPMVILSKFLNKPLNL
jgi:hypothetical protein